jgi:hypothetical protein
MWWMLLIALESGAYRNGIVVQTKAQCEGLKTQPADLCLPVEVRFLTVKEELLDSQ